MDNEGIKDKRALVASLIRFVLVGELCVREAVNKFPSDVCDDSIDSAYHALVHFEADEELRRHDTLYKEEQDDYLMMIADTLEKGDSLPQNIIDNYKEYYKMTSIPHSKDKNGFMKSFWRNLNI